MKIKTSNLNQLFQVFRYALLLLLLFGSNQLWASDKNLDILQEKPLVEVLEELSEAYEVLFSYDYKSLEGIQVNFEFRKGENLNTAINRLLEKTHFKYESFGEKYYVIYQKTKAGKKTFKKFRKHFRKIQKLEKKEIFTLQRKKKDKVRQIQAIAASAEHLALSAKEISGKVLDKTGEPLIGATVHAKGTSIGAATDLDGMFKLSVPDNITRLVFSYTGYTPVEIEIGSQTYIEVVLAENVSILDEVVVVGYGTEIKRNLTSSVSRADVDDLDEIPNTSLSNAIAGRIAGVNITTTGGRPGTSSSIRIRGASTAGFSGSTAPLYVIDNIVASKELFDLLDVNEVAEISILKDAAAAAVYGARAANGVVLVTTKSGKAGKPQFQLTTTVGTGSEQFRTKHLSAYEHALLVNQAVAAGNNPDEEIPQSLWGADPITDTELAYLRDNPYENFEGQSRKAPITQRYALNVSGGSDKVTYFIAGSYVDQTGNVERLKYNKFNLRGKVNVKLMEGLNVGLNTDIANDDDFQYHWPFDGNDALVDSYRQSTRRGNWAPAFINGLPVANYNAFNLSNFFEQEGVGDRTRTTDVTNYIITADYEIPYVEGLTVGATYNSRRVNNASNTFRQPLVDYIFEVNPNNRFELLPNIIDTRTRLFGGANGNSIERDNINSKSYQFNIRTGYERTFGVHKVSAKFIYEQVEGESDRIFSRRRNPISKDIRQLFATSSEAEDIFTTGSQAEGGRLSYIGTLGYTFNERYIINTAFRYDGSTQFLPGKRYGFFPSVSLGWIMSEEDFFPKDGAIDFLKLRASYGRTGNDNVGGAFLYLDGFQTSGIFPLGNGNASNLAIRSRGLSSRNLTWDKTTNWNLALDWEMFNSKFSGSVEYFLNKRTDLFGNRITVTPLELGATPPRVNYGAIDVSGVDLFLNYKDTRGDLGWEVGFNLGYAKDKIVTFDENPLRDYLTRTGFNSDRYFGYRVKGIIRTQAELDALLNSGFKQFNRDPYLGMLLYEDIRGNVTDDPNGDTPDGVVNGNDREYIAKHTRAPFNYGVNLKFKFKNFAIDAFIQGFEGHKVAVPQSGRFAFDVAEEGAWAHWKDAFEPTSNPDGAFPRWINYWGGMNATGIRQNSEFWLRDGGFARLKNLNISYTFSNIGGNSRTNLKAFVNGSNLLFIYKGTDNFDPELQGAGIPILRDFTGGIQLNF